MMLYGVLFLIALEIVSMFVTAVLHIQQERRDNEVSELSKRVLAALETFNNR